MDKKYSELIDDLHQIGAIKFGSFVLKNGQKSPIYCDLRGIFSYPQIWLKLTEILVEKLTKIGDFDLICGVPYTALPMASAVASQKLIPMLIKRQERKTYGTGKLIEGIFEHGQKVLIIEDVVTSGSSIIETAEDLRNEGLVVEKVLAVLDREQSGYENLQANGIELFNIFKLVDILKVLSYRKVICDLIVEDVQKYLNNNKQVIVRKQQSRLHLSYEERRKFCKNEISKRLFDIIISKKTNLCVAVDLPDSKSILELVEKIGHSVCLIKVHSDIITDFNFDFIHKLKALAREQNFLILEDRKFADIGQIIQLQIGSGLLKIGSWADFITVHAIAGPLMLEALSEFIKIQEEPVGVFVVAELSTFSNLIDKKYTEKAVKMCKEFDDIMTGFVAQHRICESEPEMLQLTPGVQLNNSGDRLGQVYNNPDQIVLNNGADIAVIGRGIIKADSPVESAENYRNILWCSYEKRVFTK